MFNATRRIRIDTALASAALGWLFALKVDNLAVSVNVDGKAKLSKPLHFAANALFQARADGL